MQAKRLIDTRGLTRDKWLIARRAGIGGSDIARIVGVSPFLGASPGQVYREKCGTICPQDDADSPERLKVGKLLERVVGAEWAETNERRIRRQNAVFQHHAYDYAIGNVDFAVVGENAGLEIKIAHPMTAKAWGEPGTDQVPLHVVAQCQWYMLIMGWTRMYVAVLFGDWRLVSYRLEADEQLQNDLLSAGTRFWVDHVQAGVAPPPVTDEDIQAMFPSATQDALTADDALVNQYRKLYIAYDTQSKAKKHYDALKLAMQAELGEHEMLVCDETDRPLVTWKDVKNDQLDHINLRADHPELYARYCTQFDEKRFRADEPELYSEHLQRVPKRMFLPKKVDAVLGFEEALSNGS